MLRAIFFGVLSAIGLGAPGSLAKTSEPDGTLLSAQPCPANELTSYDAYVDFVRARLRSELAYAAEEGVVMPEISAGLLAGSIETRAETDARIAYEGFECLAITYASDGLVISGFLWKPIDVSGEPLPLIIANRGGNRAFGAMQPWRHWGFYEFLEAGYVVLASQYRGGPGSEGQDEFGGGDLRDVKALFPLASSLGYVDMDNVFMFGGSRGGMMTYMLAREDVPVRAFAVRAGVADLIGGLERRPAFENLFREIIPDYESDPEAALSKRSAALWADEISKPAIIFHGTDDWRVSVRDATAVAEGLRRAQTPFELHLYYGDTHDMTLNRLDMMRRTIAFFERFRTR